MKKYANLSEDKKERIMEHYFREVKSNVEIAKSVDVSVELVELYIQKNFVNRKLSEEI